MRSTALVKCFCTSYFGLDPSTCLSVIIYLILFAFADGYNRTSIGPYPGRRGEMLFILSQRMIG